jgi:hypothetical protein
MSADDQRTLTLIFRSPKTGSNNGPRPRLSEPDQAHPTYEREPGTPAGIGYVTPDDEHHGRGDAVRQARRDGLDAARQARIAYRRSKARNPS